MEGGCVSARFKSLQELQREPQTVKNRRVVDWGLGSGATLSFLRDLMGFYKDLETVFGIGLVWGLAGF